MGKKGIMFFASLLMLSSFCFAGILTTQNPLLVGQTISSSNGVYELGFFSPNNSENQYVGIWFKGITPRVVVWVANRQNPVTDSTANLTISSNGSLLLLGAKRGVVWSIRKTPTSNGSRAEVSDSGNLLVVDNLSGRILWESFAHLSDTLLPSAPLMYNLATGEKRVLTSWKSNTDPSPGDFLAQITPQVPSQILIMKGSAPYYRTGPWARTRFTGLPLMDETIASPFSFQQDANGSGSLSFVDSNCESFPHLSDTLLPSAPLMYNLATGEKRVLTSWKSNSDPSPGDFLTQITPQVPTQAYTMRGSAPHYRTGPWAGTRFTGIPLMDDTLANPFIFQQDAKGSVSLSFLDRNFISRLLLTSEGSLQRFHYNGTDWEMLHNESPANSCDFYGVCGPFGLCVSSVPLKCKCFRGFVPKSIEKWKRGNWTDGCVRRTELDCQANSTGKLANGFHPVANIKPPDFYDFLSSVDAEDCYRKCLQNCSCLAFAYIRGIGCLIWNQELIDVVQFSKGGEVLSIRLARSELGGSKRKKTITASILSVSLFVILGSAAFGFWRCRVRHNESSQDAWRNVLKEQDVASLTFYDMKTIQSATNDFSLSNKLGQGGFGSVYKGKLQDGKEIAVKRLSSSSGQGKEEFTNEIVLISKLQHRNLVRILGCCIEGEERLLIYEFMMNKSLDTFLFDSRKRLEIDWSLIFNIIQGIARGLHYLHRDSRLKVIHRDLKVRNILLDEKMNPKISDFGLARMYQGTTEYQDNTRRVAGTLGYMSPEYAWTGTFSEKSDIYGFGVLLLEIISGEKISRFSYGEEGKTLIAYAWETWRETGGCALLDKDVADSCKPLEVERCVQIGLLCVQHQPVDRPNTLELLSMLTSTSDLPSPEQPTFVVHTRDEKPLPKGLITMNEITQSLIHGR